MINNHTYFYKTYFDIILSIIVLPFVLPVIVICWLLLFIPNKGKVFFVQIRSGKNGTEFKVLKFRTLTEDRTVESRNNIRHFLRETHLDELPQIFNVLKGDMSLVGPRPLLPEYQKYYDSKSLKYRNIIKPGITGLTQISGGKYLPWDRRFSLDLFYINHVTFIFDMLILCRTINVFSHSGKKPPSNQINNDISYIDYIKEQTKK